MKRIIINQILLILALLSGGLYVNAQKPSIDTSVFDNWPSPLGGLPGISNNGIFAFYTILNQPVNGQTLMVHNIKTNKTIEILGATNAAFTENSRSILFMLPKDSMCILDIEKDIKIVVPDVVSYKLFKAGKTEWLLYLTKDSAKSMIMRNLSKGFQKTVNNVTAYYLSKSGNSVLLVKEDHDLNDNDLTLEWLDIATFNHVQIWKGKNASDFTFSERGDQIAFVSNEKGGKKNIYYCNDWLKKAIKLTDDASKIEGRLQIDGIYRKGFNKEGNQLFINLTEFNFEKPAKAAVSLDLWSYTDTKLQSEQLNNLKPNKFVAVLDIQSKKITQLQRESDIYINIYEYRDDIAFLTNLVGSKSEWFWNKTSQADYRVISTLDGSQKSIKLQVDRSFGLSPSGKYAVGEKSLGSDIFSYEIENGILRNLTSSLQGLVDFEYDDSFISNQMKWLRVIGWLDNGDILICDRHDIWQLDPAGRRIPICLTNGLGRKNHMIFELAGNYKDIPISSKSKILLKVFNRENKFSGFYYAKSGKSEPEELTMGPYKYDIPYNPDSIFVKARNKDIFIVMRCSANEQYNLFITSDFKKYRSLSNVRPELKYNWFNAELHTWKALDGRCIQGILYKPESFDTSKKYPVIIHFYEKMSDNLNVYKSPSATIDNINIPWFVSQNYLVFTPDIFYNWGNPGDGAYNSIISALKYLAKFSWIDSNRIGMQGHSFGGYETNYLLTHSDGFAAAMSSSGVSDLISDYGYVSNKGIVFQEKFEVAQYRMGATIWQKPDLYLKNSPILQVDHVVTPLLMMNNKNDDAVPFAQGVQFFTALRRLGKKVWMLQYDGETHSIVFNKAAGIQHTIRVTQFFDHYLKGKPAPQWMTRGIPAQFKGVNTGLDLDYEIKTPGPGLLKEDSSIVEER